MAVFAMMSATPTLAFAGPRGKATNKPAARASKAPKKKKNATAKRTAATPTVTVAPTAPSTGTVTRMPITTPTGNATEDSTAPAAETRTTNGSGNANANTDALSQNTDAKSTSVSANGKGSPWRTAGFVGLGVGALAVGTGAVLAVMSANERSELAGRCPNDVCAETDRAAWERGRSQANTATFALAAGAVLVGTSVALVVFGGPKKEDARVELRASPSSITLAGRFQ